jgi:peptidylprolyl isomerase
MALDIKGFAKENQKLLLSMLGIVVLALVIGMGAGTDGGFFSFWSLDTTQTTNSTRLNGTNDPTPEVGDAPVVNNGNDNKYSDEPEMVLASNVDYGAVIKTDKGNIVVDLYEDNTPITVNNFVFLSNESFYDGTSFHRIKKNFVIQGGDPLGTGAGGPGYRFDDEIVPTIRFQPFVLAMANSGSDTNGSQFFITTRFSDTTSLNGDYAIFGKVTAGFDVVDSIELAKTETSTDRPLDPILIRSIQITEN